MKTFLLQLKSILLFPMLFLLLMAMSMVGMAQTVTLDQADLDYAPGETVGITGNGWQPGETVTLTVSNLTNPDVYCGTTDPHQSWTVVADGAGDFTASWFVYDCELGANLLLTTESATGFTFELFFTDAAPFNVSFASIGLPDATSVSVTYSGINNGDHSITGPSIFSSPGPSTNIGTKPSSSFSYIFPAIAGYNLISPTGMQTIQTGLSGGSIIYTGTYELACTTPNFTACPGNLTANTSLDLCSAVVNYTATASGNPAPALTYAFSSATIASGNGTGSGSTFNKGTTNVIITATNTCGSSTCEFTVTVNDNEAPSITCPDDINHTADAGQCGYTVSIGTPTTDDNCGVQGVVGTRSDALALSAQYPVGTTTIEWVVTDIHGNTATCTQNITITDDELPTITCAAAQTQTADAGVCQAAVTVVAPTFGDNCPGATITNDFNGTANASGTYPVGTTTVKWTVADVHGHAATCTQNITVTDDQAPVITYPTPAASYSTDAGSCTKTLSFVATATDNCDVDFIKYYVGKAEISFPYVFPFGTTNVIAIATDIHGNTDECDFDVVVDHITTTLAVSVNTPSVQYSDPITLTATLSPYSCALVSCQASGTVTFSISGQPMGSAIVDANGVATLNTQVCGDFGTLGAEDISAIFTPNAACDSYLGASKTCTGCLTITPDEACVVYSGVLVASSTTDKITLVLAATLTDNDANGCITNVKVNFKVDGNVVNPAPLNVGLVDPLNSKVGTASFEYITNMPQVGYGDFTVTVELVGYNYLRDINCSEAQTVVHVSKPMSDFITGGGYLKLTNSSGKKVGDVGTKNNFGFNVKWNKSIKNLQGNINTIVRRKEADGFIHTWQVKGNVMSSLTVDAVKKTGVFTGKASIQDISDLPTSLLLTGDGNATLQAEMADIAEPGDGKDLLAITVWDKSGGVWFSSNWNGTKTATQAIYKGNMQVSTSSTLKSAEIATAVIPVVETIEPILKAYPNPFTERLNIEFSSATNTQAKLEIYSITGVKLETLWDAPVEGGVLYKVEYLPKLAGSQMVIYNLTMNGETRVGKLIYQSRR